MMRMPRMSYAMVTSALALFIALGGSAWAALVVTGANVKNETLTGADVKNGSLEYSDVGAAARTSLKAKGATGPSGAKGATGDQGTTGAVGAQGTPAKNAFAWAYNVQSNLLKANPSNNPTPVEDWYAQAGTGTWTNPDSGYGGVLLELADGTNDGLLTLEHRSDVIVSAHLTGWHEDATVHSRLECRLRMTDVATNAQATVGQPILVSTKEFRHVTDLGLLGGIRRDPGTYSIRVECRDLDLHTSGYQKWFIIKGNLSVLSSRDWR